MGLTRPSIEKHLSDFGVDPESASHTQINQLSGGMKVKVVLAAAMWQNPHILILSHNKEFCDGVATEKWIMKGGYLRIEGESKLDEKDEESGNKEQKEVYDGAGNKIDVKANAKLSSKDAKKLIKDIEKKVKDNKKKKTLTDEEVWELEDKLTELKEQLKDEK